MWKRVFLVLVVLLIGSVSPGTAGATGDQKPTGCLNFTAEVFPYGTKLGGAFVTPGMHDFGLVFELTAHSKDQPFVLSAEFPLIGAIPDFEMVAFTNGEQFVQKWDDPGTDRGTIPSAADRLYIYMPVGPDLAQNLVKGTFRFDQC